jgi:hypothetical protein
VRLRHGRKRRPRGIASLVARVDERVDERVRPAARDVVVGEPEPAEVGHVVRGVEVPGDRRAGASARCRAVGCEHDLLLRVVVHRIQVRGHARDRLFVTLSARVDLPWVADAEPEQEPSSKASASTRAAFAAETASRPQMLAIPEATRMRSLAPSSTAPFVSDSRVPSPSGYHSVSYPSSSISRTARRASVAGATANALLQTPIRPSVTSSSP